jgi:hypothetical protein
VGRGENRDEHHPRPAGQREQQPGPTQQCQPEPGEPRREGRHPGKEVAQRRRELAQREHLSNGVTLGPDAAAQLERRVDEIDEHDLAEQSRGGGGRHRSGDDAPAARPTCVHRPPTPQWEE